MPRSARSFSRLDLELAGHRLLRARAEPGVEDLGGLARRLDIEQRAVDGVLEARLVLLQGEADVARLGEVGKKQVVVGASVLLHDRAQHALVGGERIDAAVLERGEGGRIVPHVEDLHARHDLLQVGAGGRGAGRRRLSSGQLMHRRDAACFPDDHRMGRDEIDHAEVDVAQTLGRSRHRGGDEVELALLQHRDALGARERDRFHRDAQALAHGPHQVDVVADMLAPARPLEGERRRGVADPHDDLAARLDLIQPVRESPASTASAAWRIGRPQPF